MTLRTGRSMTDFNEAKEEIDRAILGKNMVTIFGTCSVGYSGRAASRLPSGKRLVLIKGDNSISIHQNRLVRPTNYMMDTKIWCSIGEGTFLLTAMRTKPAEKLKVSFSSIEEINCYD